MEAGKHDDEKTKSFLALTSGTIVGHYRIVDKIGAGGMGEVYLAVDSNLNRKVALKFLPMHLCGDEDCRKRFTREAQAAAKLDHPNIAAIHEVGEFSGRPYFAMQVIEGRSLREVIAGKDLPIDRILDIAIQICEGLQAAHEKGIIHRDIKPSNILLDSHGRVRIVDFGLASVRGSEQLTRTGSTLGTIGYMSPEQVRGQEVDHRSDLFSLGVVIYELLTKQSPFKRDSEAATLKAVSDDRPQPAARYRADLPDSLQPILDKALDKDVKTRYQHADGMLADLVRVKRGFESGNSRAFAVSPMSKVVRPSMAAILVVAVAAVITLVVTKPWNPDSSADKHNRIKLAVLPFDNVGDPEDEYFAVGMADEITSKLSRIGELTVIGSYGAKQYNTKDKSIGRIGNDLNVDYVLCGTVRWQKTVNTPSRVRVTPQLIKTSDASNLWSHTYENAFSEVFAVQSSIAGQVANALNIVLVDTAMAALEKPPTKNLEAYEYFIRGREYFRTWSTPEVAEKSIRFFQKAVELDSTYVDAWVELSIALSTCYWFGWDPAGEMLKASRQAALAAERHDSLDAYSHLAMGFYYFRSNREYEKALKEFSHTIDRLRDNAYALEGIGLVQRRIGLWDSSLASLTRAAELDPLNAPIYEEISTSALRTRQFEIGERWLNKGLSLFPDYANLYYGKFMTLMARYGNPHMIIAEIDSLPATIREHPLIAGIAGEYSYWAADYERAIALCNNCIRESEDFSDTVWCLTIIGDCYRCLGDKSRSRALYDSVKVLCEPYLANDKVREYQPFLFGLSIAYDELGFPEKAVSLAKNLASLVPLERDHLVGAFNLYYLAQIYARVGKYEDALDLLDSSLLIPSPVTVPILQVNRDFSPLWDLPEFKALLKKHENDHAI